jgi:hypothetical protein
MHSTFAKKSQASRRSVTRATSCTGQQAARASPGAFLPIVQAKLRMGAPNDKYEQEADRVADVVTQMPDPSTSFGPPLESASSPPVLRRTCEACARGDGLCQKCDEEEMLRRQPADEDEDCLQTKPAAGYHPVLDPDVESGIQAVRGRGQPLSEPARRFFEPRFGRDFGGVRIHTDARAAETAAAIRARAFTIGQDVVFGASQYSPDTQCGWNLIAHELAHTVQQDRRTLQGWSSRPALSAGLPANGSLRESSNIVRRLAIPDEPPTNGLPEGETGEPTEGQQSGTGEAPEVTPPPAVAQAQVTIQPFAVSDQAAPRFNPDVVATLETSLNAGPPCGANGPAGFPAPVGRTDFFLNAHPFTVADDGAQHLGLPTVEERPVVGQDSFFSIDRPPLNDLTGILRVPSGPQTWSPFQIRPADLQLRLQSHGFEESFGLTMCAVNAPANRKFDVEVADGPALIRDVTAHEKIHERDTGMIMSSVVGRWEQAILQMKNDGSSVRALNVAAATPLIFDEIRRRSGGPGSPCGVGQAIEQGVVDAANALHGQPGGDIRVQDFRVNWPSCTRVAVDWGAFPGTPTRCAPATPDLACQPTPPLQVTARR